MYSFCLSTAKLSGVCSLLYTLAWALLEIAYLLSTGPRSFWIWNHKALNNLKPRAHTSQGNLQVQPLHNEPATLQHRLASWMEEGSLETLLVLRWVLLCVIGLVLCSGEKPDYSWYKSRINSKRLFMADLLIHLAPGFLNKRAVFLGCLWAKEVNTEDCTRFCN